LNRRQEPREDATAGTVGRASAVLPGIHVGLRWGLAVVGQHVSISPQTTSVAASTLFELSEIGEVVVRICGRFDKATADQRGVDEPIVHPDVSQEPPKAVA
jgi:hypothetical protein